MQFGDWNARTLIDGTFALDGGSMFGVVPKPLWGRTNPADERNRIQLASRLLLLEGHGRRVLVDTGLGDKWDDKRLDIFDVRRLEGGVVELLRRLGHEPEAITDVILTHLHFDHAGGTTRRSGDALELTFPRARHHVQRRQWEWACAPTGKDGGSFREEDFSLLADSGLLELLDAGGELFPGVELLVLEGHTTAMQAVRVVGSEDSLIFLADLVPTVAHLRWPYIMAYDNRPLDTLAEKQRVLMSAAREGWLLVFEHDPQTCAMRVREDAGRVVPGAAVEL